MRFHHVIWLWIAFLTTAFSANSQSANARRLLPRTDFFAPPHYTQVQLGTQGRYVWYVRPNAPDSLFYTNVHNSRYEHAVALPDTLVHYWVVPEGGVLAVVGRHADQQLLYWRAGKLKEVTPFPLTEAQLWGTSELIPNKVAMHLSAKEAKYSGVWLLDLWGSRPKRLGRWPQMERMWFDRMFNLVAAEQSDGQGGRLLLAKQGPTWDTLGYYPVDLTMLKGSLQHIVAVDAQGKYVYFTDNEGRDKTVLWRYTRDTRTLDKLAQDDQADILPWGATVASEGQVQAVVARWADIKRHIVDSTVVKDFSLLDSLAGRSVEWVATTQNDSMWLVRKLDGMPPRYYTWDRRRQRLYALFQTHPQLDTTLLGRRHVWTVSTPDSVALPVHVYLPPQSDLNNDGIPREPLPTVFYIHDGLWKEVAHWNNWDYLRHFQLLANRGYAVVVCELRRTTRAEYLLAGKNKPQWDSLQYQDIMTIIDWAENQKIAHPDKMALWGCGHSAYEVAWVLSQASNRFRCGIAMYAPADLNAFSHRTSTDSSPWRKWMDNAYTEAGTKLLQELSSTHHVGQINAPLLLIVPNGQEVSGLRQQIDAFARTLAQADRDVIYLVLPELLNSRRRSTEWIAFWAICEQFLSQHLAGRYEPVGDDLHQGHYELIYGKDFINRLDW